MKRESYDLASDNFEVTNQGEKILTFYDEVLRVKSGKLSSSYDVESELELTGLPGQVRPIRFKQVKRLEPL